eukprot:2507518-Pleurochrysis_carterae.AAC.1
MAAAAPSWGGGEGSRIGWFQKVQTDKGAHQSSKRAIQGVLIDHKVREERRAECIAVTSTRCRVSQLADAPIDYRCRARHARGRVPITMHASHHSFFISAL